MMVLFLCVAYIVKGLLWVVADVYFFKNKYNNVLETFFSAMLWPLVASKRTFDFIKKKYFNV